jgi:hypothetical protein
MNKHKKKQNTSWLNLYLNTQLGVNFRQGFSRRGDAKAMAPENVD